MADQFKDFADIVSAPARRALTVTPHDTNELGLLPKALYIGTGGTITLRAVDATEDVVFTNIWDGYILPVRASYVRATGTTAAGIIALA